MNLPKIIFLIQFERAMKKQQQLVILPSDKHRFGPIFLWQYD